MFDSRVEIPSARAPSNATIHQFQLPPAKPLQRFLKRSFDIAVSLTAGIALLPLFAIVALLIKWDSRGPVFFTQLRNGQNYRQFRILKFRSMKVAENDVFKQAIAGDQRVTALGRFLRKSSIDELPQLWNVLKGEMSIVGPRPHPLALDEELEAKTINYRKRYKLKPGLTGLAQVRGFRGPTQTTAEFMGRLEGDLEYVRNWSFLLDLKLILQTIPALIRANNAH